MDKIFVGVVAVFVLVFVGGIIYLVLVVWAVANLESGYGKGEDALYEQGRASEPRPPQWFPDGSLIAFSHRGSVYVIDSSGSNLNLVHGTGRDPVDYEINGLAYGPNVSTDGARIAYSAYYGRSGWFLWDKPESWEIVAAKPNGFDKRRLTVNPEARDINPVWSPDGSRIAFVGPRPYVISVMRADGSELQSAVTFPVDWSSILGSPAWSPDGSRIAFAAESSRRGKVMYVVEVDGSNLTRIAGGMEDGISVPVWSPDGLRIAFVKDGSDSGVFIVNPDGSGLHKVGSLPIQTVRGTDSISWSPDGSQILFRGYVVGADGSTERSHAWSDGQTAWSPDGSRIAVYASDRTDIVLYTVGPDGLDSRVLVKQGRDGLVAAQGRPLP